MASVASFSEARCEVPAGVAGAADVEVKTHDSAASTSSSGRVFMYVNLGAVTALDPVHGFIDGGNDIRISVTGMTKRNACYCKFGTVFVTCAENTDISVQCQAPALIAGNVSISVGNTFEDVVSSVSSMEFVAHESVNVTKIDPMFAMVSGESPLTLTATGFGGKDMYCLITGSPLDGTGKSYAIATAISSTTANCMVPSRSEGFRVVELTLSHGNEGSHSGQQIECLSAGQIRSIAPSVGTNIGGTVVTISGDNFLAGRTLCKFGTTAAVVASVRSTSEAQCVAPAGVNGNVAVVVTLMSELGEEIAVPESSFALFSYKPVLTALSVDPAFVLDDGGSTVSIRTNSRLDSDKFICLFNGNIVVDAILFSPTVIQCTSTAIGKVNGTIEVSLNGQDFVESGWLLTSTQLMNVSSTTPSMATTSGDSRVGVTGLHFSAISGVYCAIGGTTIQEVAWSYTAAMRLSATSANCALPSRGAGFHALELAASKGGQMSRNGVQVEFAHPGMVTALSPSTGSVNGGTIVTVAGTGFVAGRTACRFGTASSMHVEAVVMSSTEALCTSPVGLRGTSLVHVSAIWQSGAEVEFGASVAEFAYESPLKTRRMSPTVSPAFGGQPIKAFVGGAIDDMPMYCLFDQRVMVKSETVSGGVVDCTTTAGFIGNLSLEVSQNAQDFTSNGLVFQVANVQNVTSVDPAFGNTVGGSTVFVNGLEFPLKSRVYCAVGGAATETSTWGKVLAAVTSSSSLSCMLPQRGEGFKPLEISVNYEGEVTRSGVQVEFVMGGYATAISPSGGVSTGGTVVTVTGQGFSQGRTLCKFGTTIAAMAGVVSATEARCTSPLCIVAKPLCKSALLVVSSRMTSPPRVSSILSLERLLCSRLRLARS